MRCLLIRWPKQDGPIIDGTNMMANTLACENQEIHRLTPPQLATEQNEL